MLHQQFFRGPLWCFLMIALAVPANAQEGGWRVARISGEAWVTRAGASPTVLTAGAIIGTGEKIQTSRTGRAQLVRGAETVLVAPNSILALSNEDVGRTIVRQQSGSVSIEAEKKNVQHFEVRTPVLAAVVKGTQFTVTLRGGKADVSVARGQVDVKSFLSGQSVLVLPGQRASAAVNGRGTLAVTGTGRLQSIRAGTPGASDVKPVSVPRGGFARPVVAATTNSPMKRAAASSAFRISSSIGPRINVHLASKGLASAPSSKTGLQRTATADEKSLWKQASTQATGASNASARGAMLGNSSSNVNAASGAATKAVGAAAAGGPAGSAGSSGIGNAVSAAATAAAGSGGAAVSQAVRAANRRNKK